MNCSKTWIESCLNVYLSHSELQIQSAVQRALRAEEELQAALGKIQDLERQLQSQTRAEPQPAEGTETRNIFSKMENRGAVMSAELLSVWTSALCLYAVEQKKTAASPTPETPAAARQKSAAETQPKSSTRRTKKQWWEVNSSVDTSCAVILVRLYCSDDCGKTIIVCCGCYPKHFTCGWKLVYLFLQ